MKNRWAKLALARCSRVHRARVDGECRDTGSAQSARAPTSDDLVVLANPFNQVFWLRPVRGTSSRAPCCPPHHRVTGDFKAAIGGRGWASSTSAARCNGSSPGGPSERSSARTSDGPWVVATPAVTAHRPRRLPAGRQRLVRRHRGHGQRRHRVGGGGDIPVPGGYDRRPASRHRLARPAPGHPLWVIGFSSGGGRGVEYGDGGDFIVPGIRRRQPHRPGGHPRRRRRAHLVHPRLLNGFRALQFGNTHTDYGSPALRRRRPNRHRGVARSPPAPTSS